MKFAKALGIPIDHGHSAEVKDSVASSTAVIDEDGEDAIIDPLELLNKKKD